MRESMVSLWVSCSFPTKSVGCEQRPLNMENVKALTLNCSSNTFLLEAFDVLSRKLACQERVFRERFEVATTQWMSMHAHSGC